MTDKLVATRDSKAIVDYGFNISSEGHPFTLASAALAEIDIPAGYTEMIVNPSNGAEITVGTTTIVTALAAPALPTKITLKKRQWTVTIPWRTNLKDSGFDATVFLEGVTSGTIEIFFYKGQDA